MAYMSPERVAGAPASVADDLYAVGVLAYEAVLGRRAFPHDNPAALARAIIATPPPPLARLRPQLGPALTGVIDRAMAREPRLRFATAEQMRAAAAGDPVALTAGVAPAPTGTPPGTRPLTMIQAPPGTVAAPSASFYVPPRRRGPLMSRTALLTAAGVAVAMVVSVLALVLGSSSPSTPPAESVSTSTPVAPPTSSVPPPTPITTQPTAPIAETPAWTGDSGPGNGKGNGRGNGKGPKKNN
ncbi:MAG: serine/threonine protein kinase, partial [Actinomycetota bacterium]|nr:serine/threonine protein kinase [Actinomycetota bacterium]